jgi:hypothetical protein
MFPEDLRLNLVRGLVQTGTPAKDTSQGVTPTKPSYRNTHHSLVSIPFPLMWRFHQVLLVFGIVFTHNFFVSALLALSFNGFTWIGGSKVVLTMAAWEQVFLVTLLLILHVLLILLRSMRCEQIKGSQKVLFCHSCALRYKLPHHSIWAFWINTFSYPFWTAFTGKRCKWHPVCECYFEWLLRLSMHQQKFPFRDMGYGEGLNVESEKPP